MTIASTIAKSGHQAIIERPIEVRDSVGGRKIIWSVTNASADCWFQPSNSKTVEMFAARQLTVSHTVYFSSDPALFEGYRLTFDERYFIIIGMKNAAHLDRLWEVYVREQR